MAKVIMRTGKTDGDDNDEGQSWSTAFATIQKAIDLCNKDDIVEVAEGTYYENINFRGKNIIVRSDSGVAANTIIDAGGVGTVVSFGGSESSGCKLKGFTIRGGGDSDGLLAHWKLDESSGSTASDSSGNVYDGTLYGPPSWDDDGGWIDGALVFDGDDDYVIADGESGEAYSGVLGSNPRTCTAWIKTTSTSGWSPIVHWGPVTSSPGGRWTFAINSATSYLYIMVQGDNFAIEVPGINDGEWHHVAVTWEDDGTPDCDDAVLYYDGTPYTSVDDTFVAVNTSPGTEDVMIGKWGTGHFDGFIDDVRIYDRALAGIEIMELAEIEPVGHWKLDETSDFTAADSGSGNHNGTLQNMAGDEWTAGMLDNALEFDGQEDYVKITGYTGITGSASRSVCAWIRTQNGEIGDIVSWGINTGTGTKWRFTIGWSLNPNSIQLHAQGGYITSTTDVCDDRWHHVAAVFENDGTPNVEDVRLFVDGEEEAITNVQAVAINTSNDVDVDIGNYSTESNSYFKGLIDEVLIYDVALTPKDIKQLFLAHGGGINGNGTQAEIRNCVIEDNYSGYEGGGIYDFDGDIINCLISGNTANDDGGGLYGCDGDIVNCTVVNNTAGTDGDGLSNCGGTITNCIVWDNGSDQLDNCSTPDYSCVEGGVTGGTGNISADPKFVSSSDYHLLTDSPCIDAGDDGGDYTGQVDIDGDDRENVRVDIGVDEYYYTSSAGYLYYVDGTATGGDNDGSSWPNAYTKLQDALDEAADSVGNDEIWVAGGTYYPDEDNVDNDETGGYEHSNDERDETFTLVANLKFYGGFPAGGAASLNLRDWGANVTTMSGDIKTVGTDDTDNSYNVVVGAHNTVVDGFTITKGYADHASTPQYQRGGGMYNSYSPAVTNCIFDDNYALYGGGMFNDESTPTVTGCSFTDNEAYNSGGGMYCLSSGFDLNLTNCLFRDNGATNGSGGAIFFDTSGQTIDIENCTFSQNSAPNGYAGGLYSYASNSNITSTIFWDNTDADSDLDLAAASSGSITISYSDVALGFYYSGDGDVVYSNCISVDPLFADAGNDDFHLKSPDGRWNGSSWVTTDTVYSKCLAHAHPSLTYSNEPAPNGGKINMGAYGNTSEASKVNSDNLGRLRASVYIFEDPYYVVGPYDAQWRLSYEQDGTWHSPYNTGSFTMEGLVPASGYYVIFKDVPGYTTPGPYGPFSITEGNTAVIPGYYTE